LETTVTATDLVAGALAVVLVSGVIAVLKRFVDPVALPGLYLFAIFPVAIGWGFRLAGVVAVASFATFAYFFSAPAHSFAFDEPATAVGLVISLVSGYVVSDLARRAHMRAREAQARAREAEEAHRDLRRLADEQAALRRVATLVAQAVPTSQVFEAVTREVGLQCGADLARSSASSRTARSAPSPAGAGAAAPSSPSTRASSSRGRASPPASATPAAPRAWTASSARRGPSRARRRPSGSARRWASPSSLGGACGG
jgi:K+-sensing histidine kinase KdpD